MTASINVIIPLKTAMYTRGSSGAVDAIVAVKKLLNATPSIAPTTVVN